MSILNIQVREIVLGCSKDGLLMGAHDVNIPSAPDFTSPAYFQLGPSTQLTYHYSLCYLSHLT